MKYTSSHESLQRVFKRLEKRNNDLKYLINLLFEEAWNIAHNDKDLAKALIQELCAIVPEDLEKEFAKKLMDNLIEYHEELEIKQVDD